MLPTLLPSWCKQCDTKKKEKRLMNYGNFTEKSGHRATPLI